MSVTGSMYTGISGLQAQSQAISVVSNNLANTSTTAYKSSSITFEDVFYSTLSTGGTLDQVGNGVTVSAVYTDFSQGSYQSTNSATDVALTDDGFFIVRDSKTDSTYYTRDGNFTFNTYGYLVDSSGNRVQGWGMVDGSLTGGLVDIRLEDSQSPPAATSEVNMIVNLDSESTDDAVTSGIYTSLFDSYDGTQEPPLGDSLYSYSSTITVYDENGASHDLTVYFDKVTTNDDGSIVWEYIVTCDAGDDQRVYDGTDVGSTSAAGLLMAGTMTFSTSGKMESLSAFSLDDSVLGSGGAMDKANWSLSSFDANGLPLLEANFTNSDENQAIAINFGLSNSDPATGTGWDTSGGVSTLADLTSATAVDDLPEFNSSRLASNYTTSYTSSSATYTLTQDGYASGVLKGVSIDDGGVLWASYTNGQSVALYTLALADFANEQGLEALGGNLYGATAQSGQATIGTAGTAGFGDVASNCLEQSNVDTATELTNLIILQAAYQANSKVVTTANTLLQTAISMKS